MEDIRLIAYGKYQLDWMREHSISLTTLMDELSQIQYDDPDDEDAISKPVSKIFSDWEYEVGFSGSVWVCYNEFLGAEYLDEAYMSTLLNEEEYLRYLEDIKFLNEG